MSELRPLFRGVLRFQAALWSTNLAAANRHPEEVERGHIRRVFGMNVWRVRERNGAAEMLGIRPTALESRIAKLDIRRRATDRTK